MKKYLLALATFIGTIIGVGLFGLPYITSQIGFLPILVYFGVLGLVTMLIQLMYGEICLRTAGDHRLPGYIEIYLDRRLKFLPIITNSIGLYGANLAYIIIGGSFLASLLMPVFGGTVFTYVLIFFAAGALIIFLGSGSIAKSELVSIGLFFLVLIFLFVKGWPEIDLFNFLTVDLNFKTMILPYGVILFSLTGMSVIPEVREVLDNQPRHLRSIIILGAIIPIITYIIFIITVLGITGANTTTDALSGLENHLGKGILTAGYLFGVLTTFTSYLTIGITIKKILWYDLKFSHLISWALAVSIPMILYLGGLKDFIAIIAFTGSVTVGIDVVLVALTYLKAKKKGDRVPDYDAGITKPTVIFLVVFFLIGVVASLFNF